MFFWLAVLMGALLAVLAVRIGFYEMTAVFINLLVAVYLSLFLTPALVSVIPAATDIPGGGILMAIALAIGTFLILHWLCFALLTGQFKVTFPKLLDGLLAGGLGFLAGFLIVAFITTLIAITPLTKTMPLISDNDLQVHQSYVGWWCDCIHGLVGSTTSAHPTQDRLEELRRIESKPSPLQKSPSPPDPNGPVKKDGPPATSTTGGGQNDMGHRPGPHGPVEQGLPGHEGQGTGLDGLLWPTAKLESCFFKSGLWQCGHTCLSPRWPFSRNSTT